MRSRNARSSGHGSCSFLGLAAMGIVDQRFDQSEIGALGLAGRAGVLAC